MTVIAKISEAFGSLFHNVRSLSAAKVSEGLPSSVASGIKDAGKKSKLMPLEADTFSQRKILTDRLEREIFESSIAKVH